MANLEVDPGEGKALAMMKVGDLLRWCEVPGWDQTEQGPDLSARVESKKVVVPMDVDRCPGRPVEGPGAANVIDVTMRYQQRHHREVMNLRQPGDSVGVGRGVNGHRRPPFLGCDQVTIGLGQPE
jgi:hypothetical protein